LARVRRTDLAAYDNQDLPFERLVEVLNPVRSLSRHPLFQVMLTWHNTASRTEPASAGELAVVPRPVRADVAKVDLSFAFEEVPGDLRGALGFSADLFDEATARRIADSLVLVLGRVVEEPDRPVGDLDVLTADERRRLVHDWNATAVPVPDTDVVDMIGRSDRLAFITPTGELTYAELDRRSDEVARALAARGVGAERFVAVAVPRGEHLPTSLLGVLKAGRPTCRSTSTTRPSASRTCSPTPPRAGPDHRVRRGTPPRGWAGAAAGRPARPSPAHRDRTGPAGPRRLRDLHLRVDRQAQGCRGDQGRVAELAARHGRAVPAHRR
ncbi:AMP-binding protein, partial [Saccharothrix sp. MB29]|nr:AMP-binding protein [Saccharothrix sp. MB29]